MFKNKRDTSDRALLEAIRTGNGLEDAVSFLYKEYYAFLENCVRRKSGTPDDAADIIQETFLAFFDMVCHGKFREEARIKSLLYSIATNLWISEIRKRTSRAQRDTDFELEQGDLQLDVSRELEVFESKRTIMELFSTMGEACKDLLIKFYYQEMSLKEIMQTGSFSSEQVLRNKKHLCMKRLIEKVQSDENLSKKIKMALGDE